MIKYKTAIEVAEEWGITVKTIRSMCAAGKIHGAVKYGKYWAIPPNARRPIDKRLSTDENGNPCPKQIKIPIKSFKYERNNEDIRITKFTGDEKIVIVPEKIYGRKVTTIGKGFFDSGTYSEDLKKCEIVLPSTLKYIETYAFAYRVSKINLPEGLEYIGAYAFVACPIRYIYIPASVERIDEGAFYECENLWIDVDPENKFYMSQNGALFDKSMEKLLFYPYNQEKITIPETVTRLCEGIFSAEYNESEKSHIRLSIPNHVKEIGDYCFQYQPWTVVLGDNISKIGEYAFIGCILETNLDSLLKRLHKIPSGAFSEVEAFIPEKRNVKIPDNITEIGHYAFGETTISKITVAGSIKNVYMDSFELIDNMEIVLEQGVQGLLYDRDKAISAIVYDKTFYLPESLKEIWVEFSGCQIFCNRNSYAYHYVKNSRRNNKIWCKD